MIDHKPTYEELEKRIAELERQHQSDLLQIEAFKQDTAERKRAEKALRESEERFSVFMEHLPAAAFIKDPEDRLLFANKYLRDLFAWRDWSGKSTLELIPGAAAGQMVADDQKALDQGPQIVNETLVDYRGVEHIFETYKFPIRSEGHPVLLGGVAVEITARKQMEESLRESRCRLQLQIERMPIACIVWDPGCHILSWNPAAEEMFRYSEAEVLGKHGFEFIVPKDVLPQVEGVWQRLLQGDETAHSVNENVTKDGRIITCDWYNTPLKESNGRVTGILSMTQDITERKRLEAQFIQAQKMEAIGILAGGVAHDFNNLLTVINGYGMMLLDDCDPGDPKRASVEQILEAGARAASLTSQLLAFSRKQIIQPKDLNLNAVIEEMNKILHRLIGEDIDILSKPAANLGLVRTDPGQINQVIMNLAANARDAMPKGGKLTIETANVDLDEDYAHRRGFLKAGRYVMLAMSDTGIGMDANTQDHIFEPFFTTKGPGEGTGLGLSTVYGIVKQNSGYILVYSEPGKGTTFKIYLPRLDGKTETVESHERDKSGLVGVETILVVEDDPALRKLTIKILCKYGYSVLEASGGAEALRMGQETAGKIHLVITDVIMPEMSGRELISRFEKTCPGIKSLFISGYTKNAIDHHGVLDSDVAFLQKPFTTDTLARKVREVLESD